MHRISSRNTAVPVLDTATALGVIAGDTLTSAAETVPAGRP